MSVSPAPAPTTQQPVIVVRQNLGDLPHFDIGDKFQTYLERLEQYVTANEIPASRYVSLLLTSISPRVYEVLRELTHPEKPSTKSYTNLCELLKQQYVPATSAWRSRIKFSEMKQQDSEKIADWYVRVKKQAMECEFGTDLNAHTKLRFVVGLKKGAVIDRLCEEKADVTLQSLYELALSKEAANQDRMTHEAELHKLQKNSLHRKSRKDSGRKEESKDPSSSSPKCYACNKTSHDFRTCKYKNAICKKCKQKGHILPACRVRDSKFLSNEEYSSDTDSVSSETKNILNLSFNCLKSNVDNDPFFLKLSVENIDVNFEIDTGSTLSVLPLDFFKRKFSNNYKLKPSDVKLRTYDGKIIFPKGEVSLTVQNGHIKQKCSFLVVQGGQRPLIGRDLIRSLQIHLGSEVVTQHSLNSESLKDLTNKISTEYADLFDGKLGLYKHDKINLSVDSKASPKFFRPRSNPYAFRKGVDSELDRLENEGVITKIQTSDWGTPLVPVLKPDNTIRVCADYKVTVNPFLKDFDHCVPTVEEVFTKLEGGQHYTKLDFSSAYTQIACDEPTAKLLAWSTPKGIYKVNRLPFGVKPACKLFQSVIDKTLLGCEGVACLLDDIVVTGKSFAEHTRNLMVVLQRLREAGFKLNKSKCKFFQKEIKFLGHIINNVGLRKDPEKTKAILEAPRPTSTDELRAFIGTVSYHGRFLKNMSTMLSPLYQLLKKNVQFEWSSECEVSFQRIKQAIASDKTLVHFNPKLPIILECDAAGNGVAAVLLHKMPDGEERPISFASRTLKEAEKNYPTGQKEALSIYFGCNKFYQFLMGHKFIIRTDHKPLLGTFGEEKPLPVMAAGRVQRWALFLSNFDFKLEYIKGSKNSADGLSRLPIVSTKIENDDFDYLNFIEEFVPVDHAKIKQETRKDPIFRKLYLYIRDGWPIIVEDELKSFESRKSEFHIEDDVIMWGYRILIPHKLRESLLTELHSSHMGATKMKALARSYFWWPCLDKNINDLAKNCEICQTSRPDPPKTATAGWPEAVEPMERIHMDYAGPAFNNKMFLIIIDSCSKWPEVFEVSRADTAHTLEKLREVIARFGIPKCVVTDNGTCFASSEFSDFCEKNNIIHLTSPPFHPSSNGLAENFVKTFKNSLKKINKTSNNNRSFHTNLQKFLFAYRNTPHSTTHRPPSEIMFGRKIDTRFDQLLAKRGTTWNKKQYNLTDKFFKIDDPVYIRDYSRPNKRGWLRAKIVEVLGSCLYLCEASDGRIFKRHPDQMIRSGEFFSENFADMGRQEFKPGPIPGATCSSSPSLEETPQEEPCSGRPRTSTVQSSEEDISENIIQNNSPTLGAHLPATPIAIRKPVRSVKPPLKLTYE